MEERAALLKVNIALLEKRIAFLKARKTKRRILSSVELKKGSVL
jgi:hypothetical protein